MSPAYINTLILFRGGGCVWGREGCAEYSIVRHSFTVLVGVGSGGLVVETEASPVSSLYWLGRSGYWEGE